MEASAAGLAAAPGADGGEAQDGQQQGQQQPGQQDGQQQQEAAQQQPDLAALQQQLADVPGTLEQMREWMEQSQQQQQQVADPAAEPEPVDLSFVDPNSPTYDPQRAAQELLGVLEQQTADAVSKAVAPLQQQITDQQNEREADLLTKQFPELEDPKVQQEVLKTTHEWVQALGLPPEKAADMRIIKTVFMATRAAELSNQEQTPDPAATAAALEGAGGASPAGSGGQQLTAQSIVGGGAGRSPLPFG